MRVALKPHPDTPCEAVTSLEVEVGRSGGGLALSYVVDGNIGRLVLPSRTESARTDGLWRATCFEAFIRPGGGEGYIEINAAPSTQWATYGFSGYREGMADEDRVTPVQFQRENSAGRLVLGVTLDGLPAGEDWRLGLAAVIEEAGGRKSYWALAHPEGKPDFHHASGFVLDLPAADT